MVKAPDLSFFSKKKENEDDLVLQKMHKYIFKRRRSGFGIDRMKWSSGQDGGWIKRITSEQGLEPWTIRLKA